VKALPGPEVGAARTPGGEALLDALHVGVLLLDPEGRVLEMNREAGTLLERHAEAGRGLLLGDALFPGNIVRTIAEKTLRERRPSPETVGPLTRDGKRLARCQSSAVRDKAGRIRAWVCEFQDVTAVAHMEDEVRKLDRLATIGRFASTIAHEIRNPLTGIYAGVQFLERTLPPVSPQQETTYRIVCAEIERLDRIVEDMLGSARSPEPDLEETDPNDLVRKTCILLESEAERRGVRIAARLDEALPRVLLDPDLICQVLLNLGRNAVEASPGGGEVAIETTASLGAPGRGALPGAGLPPGVEFRVRDQGPGIAPGERERIFEPFRTSKKGGTGLGLYVSFQIMEKHGGALWVRTEVGKGATFSAWVPYRARAEGATHDGAAG
jgi:signal transduction histidine kinase